MTGGLREQLHNPRQPNRNQTWKLESETTSRGQDTRETAPGDVLASLISELERCVYRTSIEDEPVSVVS